MKNIEKAPGLNFNWAPDLLVKWLGDTEVNKLVNKINEEYYYWDKVKYLPVPEGIEPKDVWTLAKIKRISTPFKISFGKYGFTWFLTSQVQQMLHFFDLNIGGTLEAKSLIPNDEKNKYLISSIMEEAIASSQIEGAVTTRKHAKEMLRKNQQPRNKSEQMIVNNYSTIQKILEIKDEILTKEKLLEIHSLVAHKTMNPEEVGAFRKSDDVNVVDVVNGTIVHQPPPHEEIEELMKELCNFFNSDDHDFFIHPIVKASIVHFMMGFIHPFADGNGRTARALFYWHLLKKGYWLTEYLSISKLILKSKTQYARAFQYTEIDNNDLTYFIKYQLRTMDLAYKGLREYIQRKIDEKKKVSEFIRIQGVNERQALMLKWYYEEPPLMLTVKEIETRLAISNQTARTDLQQLEKAGFLTSININNKKQAYVRSDSFLNILNNYSMTSHKE